MDIEIPLVLPPTFKGELAIFFISDLVQKLAKPLRFALVYWIIITFSYASILKKIILDVGAEGIIPSLALANDARNIGSKKDNQPLQQVQWMPKQPTPYQVAPLDSCAQPSSSGLATIDKTTIPNYSQQHLVQNDTPLVMDAMSLPLPLVATSSLLAIATTQGKPSAPSIEKSILPLVVPGEGAIVGIDKPAHEKMPLRSSGLSPMQHNFLFKPNIPCTDDLTSILDNHTSK
ncbi:hypothetical protein ACH5RR_040955 [Cinchona calisaya]|uniref:Uncharacterized protein n=1 Tax=Cinchona calisaya TaxID=153742 RepID=A0ABD2XT88_9GENT